MKRQNRSSSAVPIIATSTVVAGAAMILAWAAYVRRYVRHDLPLVAALNGELRQFSSRAGAVAYYASRPAPVRRIAVDHAQPMLLVHSVNAAASSYEMKPLFDHYGQTRRVYSVDLPGYGFSQRDDLAYTPAVFVEALLDFVTKELRGGPVDAIGLSLGCEFLALAARARPKMFSHLALISPSGMGLRSAADRASDAALRILRTPAWSQLLYDTLVSRPSLRYFLAISRRTAPTQGLVDYAYLTSHQPGASNVPFHFVAGKLFSPDIFDTYQALTQPTLVLYGRDPFARFDLVDRLRLKPNFIVRDMSDRCGSLVHFDSLASVTTELDALLGR